MLIGETLRRKTTTPAQSSDCQSVPHCFKHWPDLRWAVGARPAPLGRLRVNAICKGSPGHSNTDTGPCFRGVRPSLSTPRRQIPTGDRPPGYAPSISRRERAGGSESSPGKDWPTATLRDLRLERDFAVGDGACEGRVGCHDCAVLAGSIWQPPAHSAFGGVGRSSWRVHHCDDVGPFVRVPGGSSKPRCPV